MVYNARAVETNEIGYQSMKEVTPYHQLFRIERDIAVYDCQKVTTFKNAISELPAILTEHWQDLEKDFAVTEMVARRIFYH